MPLAINASAFVPGRVVPSLTVYIPWLSEIPVKTHSYGFPGVIYG